MQGRNSWETTKLIFRHGAVDRPQVLWNNVRIGNGQPVIVVILLERWFEVSMSPAPTSAQPMTCVFDRFRDVMSAGEWLWWAPNVETDPLVVEDSPLSRTEDQVR
jgi:hypothetical protein